MSPQLSPSISLTTTIMSATLWIVSIEASSSPLTSEDKQRNRPACVKFYREEIERVCTAPDEAWPCFSGSKLDKEGKIDHLFRIDTLASSCCSAVCSQQEIREYFCCQTEECLHKCYGKTTPKYDDRIKHRLREAVTERLRLWQKFYPGSKPPAALFKET